MSEEDRKFWADIFREKLKELYTKAKQNDPQVDMTLDMIKQKGMN